MNYDFLQRKVAIVELRLRQAGGSRLFLSGYALRNGNRLS